MTSVHLHAQFNDHIIQCFRVIAKNVTISIKHDYRRPTLSSRCDVIGDVIIMEFIFVDNLHTVFLYMMSNLSYVENCNIFKTDAILRSGQIFRHKCHRKLARFS